MKNMLTPPEMSGQQTQAPSAQPPAGKGFSTYDMKQYFHIIVKRIWLVALCFVVSLSVMVLNLVRQVPVYRCQSTLLLTGGLPVPSRLQQKENELLRGADYIATQQRIIQTMLIQRARERMSRPLSEITASIVKVSVAPIARTSMMTISVTSLDPVLGADYANALAEEYLDFKVEERMDTSQATVISLTQQANRIRDELEKAEERLLVFEKENSVVAIHERGNIAAQYLASLSSRAASYRTERMLLEAQQPLLSDVSDEVVLATLSSPMASAYGGGMAPIAALGGSTNQVMGQSGGPSGLIERGVVNEGGWWSLKREKAMLESGLAELRKRFREGHPKIQETLQKLEEIDRSINVELQFAYRQYYSELESLSIKEQAVQRAESEWEDQALDVARKGHEYEKLQRDVNRLRGLYDLVFSRLKEVDITIGIEPESVRIIKHATPATAPTAPRKMQSLFLAALIGVGIGLGLTFGLEFIDDSIRYPEEVTSGLGLTFFGVIPAANWDPDDLRSHMLSNIDQQSGLAEAYRNVRSALLFSSPRGTARTIVMTSAVPKEGKTTTCLNLSVSLAQVGSRVLVVDGDMRRGELHKFFGLDGGRGFSDLLVGQAKPEAVVQRTGLPNLDLVATGPFPPNPAEIILRPEFNSFLDYAKRTYDFVMFDCPPVMAVSEAAILASLVEGAIFVVWAGQTSRKLSSQSVQVLRERGANLLGCVLNNLEFGRVGYYYYSTYYGQYDYNYRYEYK
ncbi:MAG: polysaccharide biosynthesis tyrosine autokinase [Verrucomicrobia bacterium]|nr:polysaccharide biosynthesis tyrosine autokinase [Verrucomicrobiota bacterium]